jgi:hypothetical protein
LDCFLPANRSANRFNRPVVASLDDDADHDYPDRSQEWNEDPPTAVEGVDKQRDRNDQRREDKSSGNRETVEVGRKSTGDNRGIKKASDQPNLPTRLSPLAGRLFYPPTTVRGRRVDRTWHCAG